MDIKELVELRRKLRVTQEQAAAGIGIPRLGLSVLESGYIAPNAETLTAYAAYLNKRLEELRQIPKVGA